MSMVYENPLCTRYSGPEMKKIFSPDTKFQTWRKLWIALAESERELGLDITEEQIEEMKAHVSDIDYERAAMYEHEVRHDVMAHVKTCLLYTSGFDFGRCFRVFSFYTVEDH